METDIESGSVMPFSGEFKCRFCKTCAGLACGGELPGMGGVDKNRNFILNCSGWSKIYGENLSFRNEIDSMELHAADLGIAPVTGAVQNIGFKSEKDFYLPYFTAAVNQNISICAGDGAPDEKLDFGVQAVKELGVSAYYFLKPYPDKVLFERIEKVRSTAEAVGMDIDAYNIVTMRNQVHLERKNPTQLYEFRRFSKLPLIIKGVFSREDVELCMIVKPEIAVVSNHGGRVDTRTGSTAEFLREYSAELKDCCGSIWVDGGIRTACDIRTARFLGAEKVLAARPFISSLCSHGISGMENRIRNMICG